MRKAPVTYQSAGVDIDAANIFTRMIKERIAQAWPEVAGEIGKFAGGESIPPGATRYVGSTDGTGTKIILAALLEQFDTIGQDAVAMGAVDTYVSGAMPHGLLDTLKVAHLKPELHIRIIDSVIRACLMCGCRLIGGETAELPDMFKYPWMVDLDVSVIGFPSPELTFVPVKAGQKVYGWLSYGPGANGFSLLRKVFELRGSPSKIRKRLAGYWIDLETTLADALLKPTPIWIQEIEGERKRGVKFAGHAHITGGGMIDNIPRILPPGYKVVIERGRWVRPAIFHLTQEVGNIAEAEMDRTFNEGIMVVSIADKGSSPIEDPNCCLIGEVTRRKGDEPQVKLIGTYNDG